MYESYKEMSRAVGARKPQEAQKAKALWAMKAAKDRKEKFHGEKNISGIELLRWTKH